MLSSQWWLTGFFCRFVAALNLLFLMDFFQNEQTDLWPYLQKSLQIKPKKRGICRIIFSSLHFLWKKIYIWLAVYCAKLCFDSEVMLMSQKGVSKLPLPPRKYLWILTIYVIAQNPLDLSKQLQMFTTLFDQLQIPSSKLSQKLCMGLLFDVIS